jgi:hypothetical protein
MDRGRRAERGQGIVEFAVIFPVFMALVFVMIDGGLVMGRYNQVNHAAQEGARFAATGIDDPDEIAERVRAQSIELLEDVPEGCTGTERICVRWVDGPNGAGEVGSYVRVEVRYRHEFVTPLGSFGIQDHLDISACAIARLERPADFPGSYEGGDDTC